MLPAIIQHDRRSIVGPFPSLALAACLLAAAGCAASESEMKVSMAPATAAPQAAAAAPKSEQPAEPQAGEVAKGAAEVPPATARKIIYNGRLTINVKSVSKYGEEISRLLKDAGGYISQTDQTGTARSQQNATWVVRVPIDRFHDYLTAITKLGEVQEQHVDSQDVTQEYYDIEARITNKQQEEKRLQKHLDDSTGKLEEILTVEREISRVRGEIETMQGRIRYLANVTSLSTITITATEVFNFSPPVVPKFAEKIARTFAKSMENMVTFVQEVTLFLVAIAPWIPLILLVALPFYISWRRHRATARREVVFVPPGTGTN